jgi:hypothetical protein
MVFVRGQAKIGGRKAGTPNKRTVARAKALREAAKRLAVGSGSFAGDGYALLTAVYKTEDFDLAVRLDAAKATMAYERPRLSNVEVTTRSLDRMMDEDFFRAWDSVASFLAQHGRPLLLEAAESPAEAATAVDDKDKRL